MPTKIISILLTTLLSIGLFPAPGLARSTDNANPLQAATLQTASSPLDNFSFAVYEARVWSEAGSPSWKTIDFLLSNETPSQLIVDSEYSDDLEKGIAAWRAVHVATDPSKVTKYLLDDKGYCEAVIFSVFLNEMLDESMLAKTAKSIQKETTFLGGTMASWVKTADKLDYTTQIASLSGDQKKAFMADLAEKFKADHPVLEKVDDFSSTLSTAFGAATTVADAIERLAYYTKLAEMSSDVKAVLREAAARCPSGADVLRASLLGCATAMANAESAMGVNLLDATGTEVTSLLSDGIKATFTAAIKTNPYAEAFMAGAKLGDIIGTRIANDCFSTDKTIEQFVKMQYLNDLTSAIRSATTSFRSNYSAIPTMNNALAYVASVKALISAELLSCDFATNFSDILYSDALFGAMKKSRTYTSFTGSVASIRTSIEQMRDGLMVNAQCELENDYPEIYELLYGTALVESWTARLSSIDADLAMTQSTQSYYDSSTAGICYTYNKYSSMYVSLADEIAEHLMANTPDLEDKLLNIKTEIDAMRNARAKEIGSQRASEGGATMYLIYGASTDMLISREYVTELLDMLKSFSNESDYQYQEIIKAWRSRTIADDANHLGWWSYDTTGMERTVSPRWVANDQSKLFSGFAYAFMDLGIGNDYALVVADPSDHYRVYGIYQSVAVGGNQTIACHTTFPRERCVPCSEGVFMIHYSYPLQARDGLAFDSADCSVSWFMDQTRSATKLMYETIECVDYSSTLDHYWQSDDESVGVLHAEGKESALAALAGRYPQAPEKWAWHKVSDPYTSLSDNTLIVIIDGDNSADTDNPGNKGKNSVSSIKASSPKTTLNVGDSTAITTTVLPANATNKAVTYKSSDPEVLAVTATGKVTAKKAGMAKVTVTSSDNSKATQSIAFKIVASISSKLDISCASVSGLKAKTYTGQALTQSPVVKVGTKTLKSGIDYTVGYKNNKNAGTATVTVTGKGGYTGMKSATFKINKAKQPMTAKAASKTAKVKTLKKKAVILTKTVTVKKKQGALSYKNVSTQKAVKKFKVNAKNGTITVPKGTKKGIYKVKIKVTAKGNANYKSGSKTVTVKVTVK